MCGDNVIVVLLILVGLCLVAQICITFRFVASCAPVYFDILADWFLVVCFVGVGLYKGFKFV